MTFQTFTDLVIGDPRVNPSVSTAIFLDTREAVDTAVVDGLAVGGVEPHPATDYGFMRWALLIVRDLLVGPRRYGELAAGLPRIPSNILAARLKELQAAGVLRRAPHSRIIVYELTPYGRELEPVVIALGAWGFTAMGDPRAGQIITPDSMTMDLRTAFRPQVATLLPPTAYGALFGPTELLIRVDGAILDVTRGDGVVDLAFAAGPGIHRIISGELAPDRAIATGVVEILRGSGALLGRFASTFHVAA